VQGKKARLFQVTAAVLLIFRYGMLAENVVQAAPPAATR